MELKTGNRLVAETIVIAAVAVSVVIQDALTVFLSSYTIPVFTLPFAITVLLFLYVLRMENFFELSADWSLLSGLSEALGQSPWVPDGRTYLHGADLYFKWRPISSGEGEYALALTLEYVLRDTRVPAGRLRDHGGYAELVALITKRWMSGLRFDMTRRWEGVVPDPQAIPGKQTRGSASITFLPTHFSKLRWQGDIVRDRAHGGWGWASFVQAEVSAGEHGAHKF